MKSKMSTFERRIEILFMIINRRYITVSELRECFSVHRNTAMKDIRFLSRYAPVYTKSGVGDGIYLLGNYSNSLFLYLSKDEEQLLTELVSTLESDRQNVIQGILNKYSMPKLRV